jgi:hypothetical protein
MNRRTVIAGMSVGALAATAVTAVVVRRNQSKLPPEVVEQIDELIDRIRIAEQDPERSEAARRLHSRLNALNLPGVRWYSGFTKWEIIRLRLGALAEGLPSDDTLNQLERELGDLAADADAYDI